MRRASCLHTDHNSGKGSVNNATATEQTTNIQRHGKEDNNRSMLRRGDTGHLPGRQRGGHNATHSGVILRTAARILVEVGRETDGKRGTWNGKTWNISAWNVEKV